MSSGWTGRMRTTYLNDRQIRPTEYARWHHARERFQRRGKDRETVEKYKKILDRYGVCEPILLGVSDRYPDVYVADGHHRAIALMDLGAVQFRFRWCWIKSFSTPMQHTPFPYHLLEK